MKDFIYKNKNLILLFIGVFVITTIITSVVLFISLFDTKEEKSQNNQLQTEQAEQAIPGSCFILEEKHCFLGEGFVTGYDSKAIGFNLPEGTPLFFPWEEGTFLITKNSSSPGDPWFSSVTLLDSQSDFMFLLVGFAPYDELGKLEEDRKILGMGDAEGDTLNIGMEVGSVLGTPLEGYGDGGYTLVVLVGDSQADESDLNKINELFGVSY